MKLDLAAARDATIPDVLPAEGEPFQGLFCGINPGLYSAATGWHFARPGNRFWPALHLSGFTPRQLKPSEQAELIAAELRAGLEHLTALAGRYRPRVIAIAGVTAYRTAFAQPRAANGLQPDPLGPARVWVVSNPSGLNAHTTAPKLAQELQKLQEWLGE